MSQQNAGYNANSDKEPPTRASTLLRFHCESCGAILGEYSQKDGGKAGLNVGEWMDVHIIVGYCKVCGKRASFRRTDVLFDSLMERTVNRQA